MSRRSDEHSGRSLRDLASKYQPRSMGKPALWKHWGMTGRHVAPAIGVGVSAVLILGVGMVTTWMLLSVPVNAPVAAAVACPDIEVVFARGTGEAPGLGGVGEPFVDALRSHVGGKSVGTYAVDYPASTDFTKVVDGANDASAHIQRMAATCPDTRLVLGGFSQGAAAMDLIVGDAATAADWGFTAPTPAEVANHVAGVVLFGNPSPKVAGRPLPAANSLYSGKTAALCLPLDPICSDGGGAILVHGLYVQSGMVAQAATLAASRL
jgi:cutinase